MKALLLNPRSLLLALLVGMALGLSACATTDPDTDNASVRPWNTPKGWENGLPSNMNEGR